MLLERYFDHCALHELRVHGDERGKLVAIEGGREVPFDIARVYYMFGVPPGDARGFHAHRALHQYAVSVSGGCSMVLDDGAARRGVRLDRPDRLLHIGPMIWHEMRDFTPDCVLMVLADAPFDEEDYIRNYEAFREAVGVGQQP